MNGIRPTVGIEFDDKYTNAKNKLLDFIKALDELDDIQKAKLAQEFIGTVGHLPLEEVPMPIRWLFWKRG